MRLNNPIYSSMIKLKSLITEIETDIQFISPDDTDLDYYDDLNKMEKESGINILSDKELVLLAIKDSKVVGALYEANKIQEFSFDIIVDKSERRKGIGKKLIDIGLSNFREFKSLGYILKLHVVNPDLIQYLMSKKLRIIEKLPNGVIMTY